jgi:hypothetical protein
MGDKRSHETQEEEVTFADSVLSISAAELRTSTEYQRENMKPLTKLADSRAPC